ncbi:MAG TPA: hypothetical protein VKM54_15975 [Myxococcota bacterium]|nr:hypothetical protein [Myxococcota bacterium]
MAKRTPSEGSAERSPAPAGKTKKLRLQLTMDEETCRALRAHCGYSGVDVGEAVTIAVRDWLKSQPPLRLSP